jgi:hypothetical protein
VLWSVAGSATRVDDPDAAPTGSGFRLVVTLLFPK